MQGRKAVQATGGLWSRDLDEPRESALQAGEATMQGPCGREGSAHCQSNPRPRAARGWKDEAKVYLILSSPFPQAGSQGPGHFKAERNQFGSPLDLEC